MDRIITKILPHRYPMLLVDKVLNIVHGESIIAQKNVSYNENFFVGHFPNNPVMPGVLIIEALAQAGALLAYETQKCSYEKHLLYLASINNAKFKRMVVPGDILQLEVKFSKQRGQFFQMTGVAKVDSEIAASVELLSALKERE